MGEEVAVVGVFVVDRHQGVLPDLSDRVSCCAAKVGALAQASPAASEDTNNLVGLLFEYIRDDRNLSPPLKKLLGLLREPLLRIAQRDQNFFSCDSHPARRLLNVIAGQTPGLADHPARFFVRRFCCCQPGWPARS